MTEAETRLVDAAPRACRAARSGALRGTAVIPGDKSISHRALMLGGLAIGETEIAGMLEGEDVLRTAEAMRRLGAEVERGPDGLWRVQGIGLGGLLEPDDMLDMGNAGTGVRLLMGLVAGHPISCTFTGDASLRRRPMGRVVAPLIEFGARFAGRSGDRLPLTVTGAIEPTPVVYRLPMASAQVKSAVLLCGLNAPGETSVIEPEPTRDHTERMLRHFGCAVEVAESDDGRVSTVTGQPELSGRQIVVPSDTSSASFPMVAALICPGSEVRIEAVGMNPHRIGLITTLLEMGADIRIENQRDQAGEPVADLVARGSELRGGDTPADRAPSMIDEFPILAMAAACAEGPTVMRGLGELRVKESDRLTAVIDGLVACGATVSLQGDDLTVVGTGSPPRGGARIAANLDHRIAMSFLVLGMATEQSVEIDDALPIETSFPGFQDLMRNLGADVAEGGEAG